MLNARIAIVTAIIESVDGLTEIEVDLDGTLARAVGFEEFSGKSEVGDRVIVNTTAADLDLGSGGRHFVIWNLSRNGLAGSGSGHLMKLRYTPLQRTGLSVEEPESPHHETLRDADDLAGQPVIACSLHSQLLPVAATLKKTAPALRLAYVMTDGGALPAGFSRTARWLRQHDYISVIISAGQAFGGDLEAVNIFSALAAAKWVVEADITIVAMGPGIAGTGTILGHTGMEQGQIINSAYALGGRPVAPLRLSQKDKRERHWGLSHHSISALTLAALAPALAPIPELAPDQVELKELIERRLRESGAADRHETPTVNSDITIEALAEVVEAGGPRASTMGRGPQEEPAFFLAAGAAAIAAALLAAGRKSDI
jgi:hypothetical protein